MGQSADEDGLETRDEARQATDGARRDELLGVKAISGKDRGVVQQYLIAICSSTVRTKSLLTD